MVTKIFVNTELNASIPCPKCGNTYQKDVSKFMGHHKEVRLKYTCKCKHQFSVLLERRRFIRKDRNLSGNWLDTKPTTPIKIADLSKYGLKLRLLTQKLPKVDDILTIEFFLDDPNRSRVTDKVRVRRVISPDTLGCEFLNQDHYDSLGKYFLFHF